MNEVSYKEASSALKALMIDASLGPVKMRAPWHSNITIYPHQLECVYKALLQEPVRMLLCDEPGFGKTIEAGLIIKELYERDRINNALVIAPAGLCTQWTHELKEKLHLPSQIINRDSLHEIGDEELVGVYVTSLHFFRREPGPFLSANWDIVVMDEAHHLAWRDARDERTDSHRAAKHMADKAGNLLLMTATPIQLGLYDFWSLVNLVRPDLFPTYGSFEMYLDNYMPTLLELKEALRRGEDVGERLSFIERSLKKHFGWDGADVSEGPEVRIEKLFILKDIIIRHRKREEFKSMVKREAVTHPVEYTDEEMEVYEDISDYLASEYKISKETGQRGRGLVAITLKQLLTSSPRALLATIRKRVTRLDDIIDPTGDETEGYHLDDAFLQRELLKGFIKKLKGLKKDSKCIALTKFISKQLIDDSTEKIIIFTRFLETQKYLREVLSKQFDVTTFNGKMTQKEKDRRIYEFKHHSQVLISTESGGEGRNLQFAHIMVNYDLPWNPVRLEQRIGRIDRIGQRRDVKVMNLATWNTVEQQIFGRLLDRLGTWESTIGMCDALLGGMEKDMTSVLISGEYDEGLYERMLEEKIHLAKKASDRFNLLEVFRKDVKIREEILDDLNSVVPPAYIKDFLEAASSSIDAFNIKERSDNSIVIQVEGDGGVREEILTDEDLRPTHRLVKDMVRRFLPKGLMLAHFCDSSIDDHILIFIMDKITKRGLLVGHDGSAWKHYDREPIIMDTPTDTMMHKDDGIIHETVSAATLYAQKVLGYENTNLRPYLILFNKGWVS